MLSLERISKTAAGLSVLLIVLLLLVMHPQMTLPLRIAGAAALVIGLLGASRNGEAMQAAWIAIAFVAPAFLRLLAGREGEVLDVVWMAGLAGAMLRSMSWSGWALPTAWRIVVGGWALALSLAWPVLVAREISFDLHGLYDIGAINSWAGRSAPEVAGWILFVVLAQLLGILWFDWLRTIMAARPGRMPLVAHALWIGTTVSSVVALLQGTIDMSLLSTPAWASERRAAGTLLDANAYGVCAAIAAPIALLAIRSTRDRRWARSSAVLALNWIGMWMSGSRTALLCGAAGAAGLAAELWFSQRRTTRAYAPVVVAAIVVIAVIGIAAGAIGPVRRLLDIPVARSSIAELWNRGGYGIIAVQMVREHPVVGVGAGSYHFLAPDYWRTMTNTGLAWDNAQNWWRHQAAELGLVVGLLPIVLSVLIARRVLTFPAEADTTPAFAVRGLLIGVGVISLLGMPTQIPVVLLWFYFLVAWLIAPDPIVSRPPTAAARAGWIVVTVLAIVYAAGHLVLARGPLAVEERARRTNRDYVMGAYPSEALPESNQFNWTDDESRFVWRARTPWLTLRLWAQHPDIDKNPVQVTITTPCGPLFAGTLNTTDSVSLGVVLPKEQKWVDITVAASRTWQPSTFGTDDERHLGVAVVGDFVGSSERALSQMHTLTWPCGLAGSR